MQSADPLKTLIDGLPSELYQEFVVELDQAIRDVCALVRNPEQAGARIQNLAEVIRSWHLTLALMQNEAWVRSMDEVVSVDSANVGTIEDLRALVS